MRFPFWVVSGPMIGLCREEEAYTYQDVAHHFRPDVDRTVAAHVPIRQGEEELSDDAWPRESIELANLMNGRGGEITRQTT